MKQKKIKMGKWMEITARENHEVWEGRFMLSTMAI